MSFGRVSMRWHSAWWSLLWCAQSPWCCRPTSRPHVVWWLPATQGALHQSLGGLPAPNRVLLLVEPEAVHPKLHAAGQLVWIPDLANIYIYTCLVLILRLRLILCLVLIINSFININVVWLYYIISYHITVDCDVFCYVIYFILYHTIFYYVIYVIFLILCFVVLLYIL